MYTMYSMYNVTSLICTYLHDSPPLRPHLPLLRPAVHSTRGPSSGGPAAGRADGSGGAAAGWFWRGRFDREKKNWETTPYTLHIFP